MNIIKNLLIFMLMTVAMIFIFDLAIDAILIEQFGGR